MEVNRDSAFSKTSYILRREHEKNLFYEDLEKNQNHSMGLSSTDYSCDTWLPEIVTNWAATTSRVDHVLNIQSIRGKITTKAVKYR